MPYDPMIYRGSAAYYVQGRPPYARALASTLTAEVGLDGSGRLLDVGCGPGTLTICSSGQLIRLRSVIAEDLLLNACRQRGNGFFHFLDRLWARIEVGKVRGPQKSFRPTPL